MKHSLILLVGLSVAGATAAQSSVTMYGTVDAAIGEFRTAGDDGPRLLSTTGMNSHDTVFGITGVEDIGGNLSVGFKLENALMLNDGGLDGTFWSSAANVWIRNSLGTLTVGRGSTPSALSIWAWELNTGKFAPVTRTYAFAGSGDNANSLFRYQTPAIGNFRAALGYIFRADNNDRDKWDLGLIYDTDPIDIGFSISKEEEQDASYVIGGRYNFGIFSVATSYNNARGERRGFSLGGRFDVAPLSVTLDITHDTRNKLANKKYTNGLLTGQYSLSKRTSVYAAFLRLDNYNNYSVGLRHDF